MHHSIVETVVISFIFLLFTTEVKIQIEKAKGQFIKENCVENLTQSFSFFHLFSCPLFFFFLSSYRFNPQIIIRQLASYKLVCVFWLNQNHSSVVCLEKLCEAQKPMTIMKIFLMFTCNCTISTITYVIKSNTLIQERRRLDISLRESRIQ